VRDAHAGGLNLNQLRDKVVDVAGGNPGRAAPRLDIAGLKIRGLHRFKGFDVG